MVGTAVVKAVTYVMSYYLDYGSGARGVGGLQVRVRSSASGSTDGTCAYDSGMDSIVWEMGCPNADGTTTLFDSCSPPSSRLGVTQFSLAPHPLFLCITL